MQDKLNLGLLAAWNGAAPQQQEGGRGCDICAPPCICTSPQGRPFGKIGTEALLHRLIYILFVDFDPLFPRFLSFKEREKTTLSLSLISHLKRKNIRAFDTIFLPFLINRYFHKTAFESVRKVSVKKIQNGRFLQWRFRGGAGKLLSNRRDINTHV